ncbi:hypothetical protein E2C01_098599 [Portunus trituberculatus]|uniref:Uncharacterized protein n=1 Tax=Portunus trituberculatus TaxID=210409 RepID=A0A5B7K828_PORTR|nr:hypothetical protein [Portunus trituberculatus]
MRRDEKPCTLEPRQWRKGSQQCVAFISPVTQCCPAWPHLLLQGEHLDAATLAAQRSTLRSQHADQFACSPETHAARKLLGNTRAGLVIHGGGEEGATRPPAHTSATRSVCLPGSLAVFRCLSAFFLPFSNRHPVALRQGDEALRAAGQVAPCLPSRWLLRRGDVKLSNSLSKDQVMRNE